MPDTQFNHAARGFIFLRHGSTIANQNLVACGGDQDSKLTDIGRQQIREAAEEMQKVGYVPHLIITSDISRTSESAMIIMEQLNPEAEILYDADFKERFLGDWNGQSHTIVDPLLLAGDTPNNGESRAVFRDRAMRSFNRLMDRFEHWPLIIGCRGHARLLLEMVQASDAAFFPNGRILKVSITQSDDFEVERIEKL